MKVYLGDSVYAEFDTQIAGDVLLTTENGYGPTNTIYLENGLLGLLNKMYERAATDRKQKQREAHNDTCGISIPE
jgi:hypothetical protein